MITVDFQFWEKYTQWYKCEHLKYTICTVHITCVLRVADLDSKLYVNGCSCICKFIIWWLYVTLMKTNRIELICVSKYEKL